jgi:hypothetical protein
MAGALRRSLVVGFLGFRIALGVLGVRKNLMVVRFRARIPPLRLRWSARLSIRRLPPPPQRQVRTPGRPLHAATPAAGDVRAAEVLIPAAASGISLTRQASGPPGRGRARAGAS